MTTRHVVGTGTFKTPKTPVGLVQSENTQFYKMDNKTKTHSVKVSAKLSSEKKNTQKTENMNSNRSTCFVLKNKKNNKNSA